ncbi:hypothetical protein TRIP_C20929 [Candidatus Zixiibacteriota bacterium]|nr:hypothetical protein TRIP_C20929 [candidate division Zixibacteria bacterium]
MFKIVNSGPGFGKAPAAAILSIILLVFGFSAGYSQNFLCGDVNNDGKININDMSHLIRYLYKSGSAPLPAVAAGDADNNGQINVIDVSFLINAIYRGGIKPCADGYIMLEIGQSKIFGPAGETIGFDSILTDNRCPIGVYCFWEGEATTRLHLWTPDSGTIYFSAKISGLTGPQYSWGHFPVEVGNYTVTILDLSPYPDYAHPEIKSNRVYLKIE